MANEVVHDRAVQDLEPARARGLADDDMRDVLLAREAQNVVVDAPRTGGKGDGLTSQPLGEPHRLGDAVALLLAELQAASRLDAQSGPGCMQPVRQALGIANEPGRPWILAHAHQNALARGPGTGNSL